MISIFNYADYKAFIVDKIESLPGRGRGVKSSLAKYVACHTAYVSQVLNQYSHFTEEQLFRVTNFFQMTEAEQEFFLLIASENKAGDIELKKYYQTKISKFKEQMLLLKNRLDHDKSLSLEEQVKYYSSWIYSAVDVLLTTSENDFHSISKRLNISEKQVAEIAAFLVETNLLILENGKYRLGTQSLHLASDSPMIFQHHTNWRLKSLENLKLQRNDDLHYSSCISVSEEDFHKIREILVETVAKIKKTIKTSDPEDGFAYSIDLFRL